MGLLRDRRAVVDVYLEVVLQQKHKTMIYVKDDTINSEVT